VEGSVENTNRPKGILKMVWEILPGDRELIFRKIRREDIDPYLFSTNSQIDISNLRTVPYYSLDSAGDGLDRVWTGSIIRINSDVTTSNSPNIQNNQRTFNAAENNKGLICPFSQNLCQEGWCQGCCIYLNRSL
jgi:hypothetical protein